MPVLQLIFDEKGENIRICNLYDKLGSLVFDENHPGRIQCLVLYGGENKVKRCKHFFAIGTKLDYYSPIWPCEMKGWTGHHF